MLRRDKGSQIEQPPSLGITTLRELAFTSELTRLSHAQVQADERDESIGAAELATCQHRKHVCAYQRAEAGDFDEKPAFGAISGRCHYLFFELTDGLGDARNSLSEIVRDISVLSGLVFERDTLFDESGPGPD